MTASSARLGMASTRHEGPTGLTLSRKRKVLCLHGMGTSAAILRRQLQPLLTACAGDPLEFVYLEGQHPCPPVRVPTF